MAIRRLCTILAVFIVLGFCLPGMKAQKNSKPLTKQDVLDLLAGDVPPERVAAIVRERGVSFELTRAVEEQIRQAGGNDELLKVVREVAPKPSASPAGRAVLLIDAKPGGARVYLDDEPVGTTSPEGRLKLSSLSPGAHRVRLAHRDFQDHEETVQLTSGETTRVNTNLVAAATTPVQTPAQPGATVTNPTPAVTGAPGYLGVRPAGQQPAGSKGVVISDAAAGAPADRAGLKPSDTIISIGGREVRTPQELEAALAGHKAGETVEVTWSSGGSVTTKSIQLSARWVGASDQPGIVRLPVMHDHGSSGRDYCVGVMAIGNGMIQYASTNGTHAFNFPLRDVDEATKNVAYLANLNAFHIRLVKGDIYNFVALDSHGQFQPPDAVLAAIDHAMGKP